VPRLTDREFARLADGWRDNTFLAKARDHALSPNAPLVVEVLTAFERVDAILFDPAPLDAEQTDDGEPAVRHALGVALRPQLANSALKAIRDALAAAYARPILGRAEYIALIGPWRRLFPSGE